MSNLELLRAVQTHRGVVAPFPGDIERNLTVEPVKYC